MNDRIRNYESTAILYSTDVSKFSTEPSINCLVFSFVTAYCIRIKMCTFLECNIGREWNLSTVISTILICFSINFSMKLLFAFLSLSLSLFIFLNNIIWGIMFKQYYILMSESYVISRETRTCVVRDTRS